MSTLITKQCEHPTYYYQSKIVSQLNFDVNFDYKAMLISYLLYSSNIVSQLNFDVNFDYKTMYVSISPIIIKVN